MMPGVRAGSFLKVGLPPGATAVVREFDVPDTSRAVVECYAAHESFSDRHFIAVQGREDHALATPLPVGFAVREIVGERLARLDGTFRSAIALLMMPVGRFALLEPQAVEPLDVHRAV